MGNLSDILKSGDIQRFIIALIVMTAFAYMIYISGETIRAIDVTVTITDFDLEGIIQMVILSLTAIVASIGSAYFVAKAGERKNT